MSIYGAGLCHCQANLPVASHVHGAFVSMWADLHAMKVSAYSGNATNQDHAMISTMPMAKWRLQVPPFSQSGTEEPKETPTMPSVTAGGFSDFPVSFSQLLTLPKHLSSWESNTEDGSIVWSCNLGSPKWTLIQRWILLIQRIPPLGCAKRTYSTHYKTPLPATWEEQSSSCLAQAANAKVHYKAMNHIQKVSMFALCSILKLSRSSHSVANRGPCAALRELQVPDKPQKSQT